MNAVDFLNQTVHVKIDRPLGSRHPKHGFVYSANYGYVPNTPAPDGDDLDAYVLGVFDPLEEFTGRCLAIVHRLDDDDDKLIVVPEGRSYSDEQIQVLVEFQERFFTSIIRRSSAPTRPTGGTSTG
jgi:inorganic pyrophosphatase